MSSTGGITKTYHIRGMFCAHCEDRIKSALLNLPFVESANVSWPKESAVVSANKADFDEKAIINAIEEAGYEVMPASETRVQIISLLVIILALWIIAERMGLTKVFNLFPRIETSLSLGALFLTGILTSVHCLAMCGGINLSQSVMAARDRQKLIGSNLLYHLGRVLSYTLIGAIAGAVGSVLSPSGAFKGIVAVLAGVAMVIMALNMLGVFKFLRHLRPKLPSKAHKALFGRVKSKSSLVIGLLNGLMPCGPLQAMQLCALSTGSALKGALSMLSFSLGTVPLMLGFGLISGKLNRKYSRVMLTVSPMLIFVMGLNSLSTGLTLSGVNLPQGGSTQTIQALVYDDVQELKTEIDYGSYPSVKVKSGVPVSWTITVPEGKLNGCNGEILIREYGIDLVLHEGENHISFLPEKTGSIPYSCWMGMIRGTIEVTP